MTASRCIVLLLVSVGVGLDATPSSAQSDWNSPPIEDCISVRLGATGEAIHLDRMMSDLTNADVVFLGETHDDDTTHRVEWAVYEGLLKRRESKVVLALEMFERDVQPKLDEYLAGKIDESTFLATARPWQNYQEAYRPMIETAKSAGAPVVASNFPRPLRMKMSEGAAKALEELGPNRGWAPAEFLPNSGVYWKRTENAVRGHRDMMPSPSSGSDDRLYSVQSLWDNSMGESCALALDRNPGYSVVHVNGGFHSSYWDGTVGQLKQRKPDAKIKTVAIVPAKNPTSARMYGAPVADYVVFAEQRATNRDEELRSVFVNRRTDYQLFVPTQASAEHRVPLLIWLGTDGQTADNGLKYWKNVLGDKAAIVVLEPPFRELQRDLSTGGRWFWTDNFSEDVSAMVGGVERVWSYVLERFPIDPDRVCLAGEGTGATVAAAVTLLTERMKLNSVAIEPQFYAKLKDFSLPLLEDWGDQKPPHRLQIIAKESGREWWAKELKEYESVGLNVKWNDLSLDAWKSHLATNAAIFHALGNESAMPTEIANRRYILVETDSPLHLIWARLAAQRASIDKTLCVVTRFPLESPSVRPIEVVLTAGALAVDNALPKCPGPFGGTTILVVDNYATEPDIAEWLDLEKADPLNKQSRFHRLRIATRGDGERGLFEVLTKLLAENRTNVLIVPAQFYAGEESMRELETKVGEFADRMTIHWLPGLGGQDLPMIDSPK